MPNKSTIFIKLPHKMIAYILNKDHICKLLMCLNTFEKQTEFNIFSFNVYFKMAVSIGRHFENIKSQYLNE